MRHIVARDPHMACRDLDHLRRVLDSRVNENVVARHPGDAFAHALAGQCRLRRDYDVADSAVPPVPAQLVHMDKVSVPAEGRQHAFAIRLGHLVKTAMH